MKRFIFLCSAILLTLTFSVNAQQTKRIFMIGNSVTDGVNYDGFKNMALSQGNAHTGARHMILGSPLGLLWDSRNGGGYITEPFGPAGNAFVNYEWDVVTIQPFDSGMESDKQILLNYANLIKDKSPDVQFYIYSRYPRVPGGGGYTDNDDKYIITSTADDWAYLWNRSYKNFSYQYETRDFFEDLYTSYNATDRGGLKPALIIPVGDVMYAFNAKAKAGKVPGFTSVWGVYSDGIHMSNIGMYIVMSTFYSTIYKEDIRGTKVPANYGTIDPDVVQAIQETIYEVVFTHPYSGTTVDDLVPVSSVEISEKNLSMSVFNRKQLTAAVAPSNAAKKGVIWSSSNTGVAIVDQNGRITSVAEGTATITVTTLDRGLTDNCEVTVTGMSNGITRLGVLAYWNLNGKHATENNNSPATTILPGVGVTNAVMGEGLNPGWNNALAGSDQTALDLVSSISDKEYASFTVKPEKGSLISINTVEFKLYSQGGDFSRSFSLLSNIKGFTAGKEIETFPDIVWSSTDLSANISEHNNLDEVEFRMYVYGHNNVYESAGIESYFTVTGGTFTPTNNAPTAPSNIHAIEVTDTYINFEWDEATDDYFVKGYNFYLGDEKINDELIEGTTFMLTGLTSGQLCDVSVEAVDFFDLASETKGSFSIHANRPPIAVITPAATNGKAPLTIAFASDASTDPDEDEGEGDYVYGFDWYVNGEKQSFNGNIFEYTFTKRGDYVVGLVVVDRRGMRSIEASETTISVTADKYTVSVTDGATSPVITDAFNGDEVTIVANTPAQGMAFDKWTSNDVTFDDATSATTTFTMPAKAVTVIATYKSIYAITVTYGTADSETASSGNVITITADEPEEGMEFDKWTSNDVTFADETSTETTFTMPAKAVEVTATYKYIEYTITIEGGIADYETAPMGTLITITAEMPTCGCASFTGWTSDDVTFDDATSMTTTFVMPAKAVEVTATYKYIEYTITVIRGIADYETAPMGTLVTIEEQIFGCFVGWSSDDVEIEDINSYITTFVMPAKDVTVEALFEIGVENADNTVRIFPNPAEEYITIMGIADAAYTIATVTGVTVQSGVLNGEPVYIGALPTGFYLMKAGTQTLNFIKE